MSNGHARTPAELFTSSYYIACEASSRRLLEQARRIATRYDCILIRGESGSGRDMLAQAIHFYSDAPEMPLLRLDCSLPPELAEIELFGHDTVDAEGKPHAQPGILELAGAGTIVLDEVAALPMPLQARLVQLFDERKFERVGGAQPVTFHGRLIALTGVDLQRAVARRTFREDLYYRLATVALAVLPLRQRPADIAPLARHFVSAMTRVHRKPALEISPEAIRVLEAYSFPGNVRELRQMLECAVLHAGGAQITPADLPAHVQASGGDPLLRRKMSLDELERLHIISVLDFTRGKKTRAAQILGISRKTLLEKRKRYGLA